MGRVAIVLEETHGVVEVNLLPTDKERYSTATLFAFVGRLAPVIQALDEGLRVATAQPRKPPVGREGR